jgi:glutamate formiminotransferase/glutamate formiminotransferase/formiminotetrahydrofolate cyclodeaminase
MTPPILLAVPNVSEGRDMRAIGAIADALAGPARASDAAEASSHAQSGDGARAGGVRLLDVHSDADHHRSVYTIAGPPGELADALLRGAEVAVQRIDVMSRALAAGSQQAREQRPPGQHPPGQHRPGQHPHVGALDVAPVVYLSARDRGAACAEALVVADRIGSELGVPVFLYGEITADPRGVTRGELRRGGVGGLATRMSGGGDSQAPLSPDFGPARMHPTAGATLVAAREPLVAFNLRLSPPATVEDAGAIAARIRDGGAEGLPGVRAIGIALSGGAGQVSMNIERPLELPLARVIEAVTAHAGVASAELVGLTPRAALAGFPEDVPLLGFDPARHVIENALGS